MEKIGRKYFYVKKDLKELKDKIDLEPFSVGLPLGELKENKFVPSPALLDMLCKYSDKKVHVNEKGQEVFLYGNDVFEENITKGRDKEGLVLVINDKEECLGYGDMIFKGKKKVLKNILDRGDYLRRERY